MKIRTFIFLFLFVFTPFVHAGEAAKSVTDLARECALTPYNGANEFITPQNIHDVYERAKRHTDVLTDRSDGGLEARDEVPKNRIDSLREQLHQYGIKPGELEVTLYGVLFPKRLNYALQIEGSWVAIIYVVQEDTILAVAGRYRLGGEIRCLEHTVAEVMIETAGEATYF